MKPTQTSRILNYLVTHPEGVYVYELMTPLPNGLGIAQYNARILELRRKGWAIKNDHAGHFVLHMQPVQLSI